MKKTLLVAATALFLSAVAASAQTTLLAGYDFQTAPGTPAAAVPSSPSAYGASFGTSVQLGTAFLYLDGTHGSSNFVTTMTGDEVTAFAGTAVNAGTGFSTSTAGSSALALLGGAASGTSFTANGKTAVFTLSTTGYQSLTLSFATQRTGTGFTGNTFSYSLDGVTFTSAGLASVAPAAAFATVTADFSAIAALNNAPLVYIGYTLAGATSAAGNNRLDNIQFNATAVPEPATYAYVIAGLGGLALVTRRRRATL